VQSRTYVYSATSIAPRAKEIVARTRNAVAEVTSAARVKMKDLAGFLNTFLEHR
jgi:hypothetical protein